MQPGRSSSFDSIVESLHTFDTDNSSAVKVQGQFNLQESLLVSAVCHEEQTKRR